MSVPPQVLFAVQSAFSTGSAVLGVATQAANASAQAEANEIAQQNAIEARDANYDQLALMAEQETAAAEQQIAENDIEALQATERARVAAGEAGVSGLSVDALLADMYGKQARFTDSVTKNLENSQQQIAFEKSNVSNSYKSTVNNLPTVQKPNYLGAALQGGAGVFDAYKTHLKID